MGAHVRSLAHGHQLQHLGVQAQCQFETSGRFHAVCRNRVSDAHYDAPALQVPRPHGQQFPRADDAHRHYRHARFDGDESRSFLELVETFE